ncbi:U4/U6 small nuclear ribonucleoprotein Prp3 [Metarhizium acridum CQMa 102]|uniref:U4/U6 small nuclear ribonucleoprotein Prp3 n=1 Tax=Metarhizium acridum (strain CQMa 102) TaxID=655827 RepID=E9EGX7_METAQ|nr:U4/U6 small nuclear ribonucleoprotein Prp3 [Metarhizium acridum CQMa 102]EFY84839.1 U4/U6 small nuclear ribonucleoprotein Prp3 [Metarhizium acridum CQMa 102]
MDLSKTASLGPRRDASARIQKPDTSLDRLAALKARVAAATGASKAKGVITSRLEDSRSRNSAPNTRDLPIKTAQLRAQQHAGHSPYRTLAANSRKFGQATQSDAVDNPYLDENLAHQSSGARQREPRRLVFNQKGKYIQQASALRRQAALEAMKKRIAEQTRKAGINEDLDVEKNFVVEQPPDVEWWDEGLIDGNSYEQIGNPASLKIISPDSIVTEYIQHPVALEPPQDRHVLENKAMFLTSKEQAKIRRQRRMAELKEMQAKIRLGLIPAPPPKVKKGNLMRVLGDDQKKEKLSKNQQRDADKGIHLLVFKISSLANGQHRYKIGMNATQLALSGICIMHPKFNLVVVEGGAWSINKYKKLMLNRIDWTENSPSRTGDDRPNSGRDWLQAEDQDGALKDMSLNECKLVFEGEQKARVFRRWSSKVCETDAEAREALARAKLETFWSMAKGLS